MSARPGVRRLRAHVLRWHVETPVRTSFGVMHDRPMVLVEAEGEDGLSGWGEAWCNFPTVGAEHRARLVESVLAPLVAGAGAAAPPAEVFEMLTAKTAVLALQSGEPGPIAQSIAGVDIALWDLAARRAGEPLWRFLGGREAAPSPLGSPFDGDRIKHPEGRGEGQPRVPRVKVYASGLNPDRPEELAATRRSEGYTAFKLKVGFGADRDVANLNALRSRLGPDVRLMVDANQGWSLEEAIAMVGRLAPFKPSWLEEPLRADAPLHEWQALHERCPVPLAAGENFGSRAAFDAAIDSGVFAVIQPDMAKWGGFSGCLPVARRILERGLRFCPHYLGGGVGLLASAHLLAAAGGDGMLEIDANPNPLRTEVCGPLARIRDGEAMLGEEPGIGVVPNVQALRQLCPRPI